MFVLVFVSILINKIVLLTTLMLKPDSVPADNIISEYDEDTMILLMGRLELISVS